MTGQSARPVITKEGRNVPYRQKGNTMRYISEQDATDRYNDFLDEIYGEVVLNPDNGLNWPAHRVILELDPTAHRCGMNDWLDSEDLTTDEDEAETCDCGEMITEDNEGGDGLCDDCYGAQKHGLDGLDEIEEDDYDDGFHDLEDAEPGPDECDGCDQDPFTAPSHYGSCPLNTRGTPEPVPYVGVIELEEWERELLEAAREDGTEEN